MDQARSIQHEPRLGQLDVFASGIAHVTASYPLSIKYADLEMDFNFITTEGKSWWETSVSDKKLIWNLYNFVNLQGQGILKPMHLGTVLERKLYGSFFVWTIDPKEGLRVISYNLCLGEEVKK